MFKVDTSQFVCQVFVVHCAQITNFNSAEISCFQFTVTKVEEDEQNGSSKTPEQKNKNKNGPVSQFHLLQVRHEIAILSSNYLIRFCLDLTSNNRHDTGKF